MPDLRSAYDAVYSNLEFYGVLIQTIADTIGSLAGFGEHLNPDSLVTYRIQGLVSISIFLAASAVASLAVFSATRSRLAAGFSWAVATTIPLMSGMAAINYKDVPVASGLLLVSSGLTFAVTIRRRWWSWIAAVAALAAGSFTVLAVRISAWLLILMLIVSSVVLQVVWLSRRRSWPQVWRILVAPVLGMAFAVPGLVALNPLARIDIVRWPIDAFLDARAFAGWGFTVRTLGHDLDPAMMPWWYLPAWFVAQMPLLVTAVAIAGVVAWAWGAVRSWTVPRDAWAMSLTPFVMQLLLLPIAIAVSGAVFYDGLRHVLFSVAALGPVSAIAVNVLQSRPTTAGHRARAWAIAGVMVVPLVSLVADLRWFPYQYAHVNIVAQHVGGDRPWELDYWGVTVLEGVERLREVGLQDVVVLPELDPRGTAQVVGPLLTAEDLALAPEPVGVYVFRRWDFVLPKGCERLFTIERAGQLLGEAGSCPPGITGVGESRSGQ